ncbi:YgfZ/GcvT domain-containing protein [Lacibacterium aquatile]|uniref:YgfZ/GcvT domain-containing protein n=1 Tax=Lacibacterium aquatile TaxID=1168082 RepID=A0ABW5DU40_9PROT
MTQIAELTTRTIVAIRGEDRVTFLDALITNSLEKAAPGEPVYAAFLTPQGKYLFDFTVIPHEDVLLIDVEASRASDLVRRLSLYKLRAKATLTVESDLWRTYAAWDGSASEEAGRIHWTDPRHPDLGQRFIQPREAPQPDGLVPEAAYHAHRYALGIPEGSVDLPVDKALLVESGFDELQGVAWDKGCYIGQELTARTKYRGLVKRRLVPVRFEGAPPAPGTPLLMGERDAGDMRGGTDGIGLALIRLEFLTADALTADGKPVHPSVPDWVRLPQEK